MVSRSFFIYTLKKYNLKLQIKVFSFSQGIDIKNKASANSKQRNLLGRNFYFTLVIFVFGFLAAKYCNYSRN